MHPSKSFHQSCKESPRCTLSAAVGVVLIASIITKQAILKFRVQLLGHSLTLAIIHSLLSVTQTQLFILNFTYNHI
jgi:hypothetical protein